MTDVNLEPQASHCSAVTTIPDFQQRADSIRAHWDQKLVSEMKNIE